ncbi:MAG: hypothetical protein LBU74_06270 [Methanobacteriaceae archaeon]|jgi:hypothetical protein|nr:hypothetical protein [Candidatus Methanorudis spinitermitis]
MIIIKEDVFEETTMLDDGTKKFIEYGSAKWDRGIRKGSPHRATIFDFNGNVIEEGLSPEEARNFHDKLDDETKKLIGRVRWDGPNTEPPNDASFSNWRGDGKLTAEHMRITLFDKEGNIIKKEIKVNKYKDEEKFKSLVEEIEKANPGKIL